MNILVTGANGQLGCSLREVSVDYPCHKFVYTDMPQVDITDRVGVRSVVEVNAIDVIINCAAYTAVDRAETDAALARKINMEGAHSLAIIAKECGIKMVHISTDYVFSGESCHPLKESDLPAPTGVYGETKLEGEQSIESTGANAAVIRTAWLYSPYGSNFVKTMLRVGSQRDTINVVYDQIGTPTYAPDLARAIMRVAEREINGFELYHFSNEGAISWYDFAKEIFSLAGVSVAVNAIESAQYPTPAARPAYSVLSKEKIKSIGVSVPYWRDSLQKCIKTLLDQ